MNNRAAIEAGLQAIVAKIDEIWPRVREQSPEPTGRVQALCDSLADPNALDVYGVLQRVKSLLVTEGDGDAY